MTMNADFEATVRYKRGMELQTLIDQMVADGVEPEAAVTAARRVETRVRTADRKRGFTNLIFGTLIFAIGATVTIWSWATWGGVFMLAYGPLLAGPFMAFLGISQIASAGKDNDLARR